jgi:transposase InsO family protein
MAGDGVAVDAELAGAVASWVAGERFEVAARCRDLGVSRTTFYKYVARFSERGVDGFFPDSRRPLSSPGRVVGSSLEEAVVRARKELDDAGWDHGPLSVLGWLDAHRGQWRPPPGLAADRAGSWLPSRMTVHRVLTARGMITAQPRKRPRRVHRFEASAANQMWQMDGFEVALAAGGTAVVIQALDDCTRMDLVCHAARSENAVDVWAAFSTAAARYGLPARLLTDNGTAFSGRRRGWTSALETGAAELGVRTICSSVAHPQTCGKVERAHQTALRWLARRPAPADLNDLQNLLERYRTGYNDRPHQGLHGLSPNQRWQLADHDGPSGPTTPPLHVRTAPVSARGSIGLNGHEIGLGRRYAGRTATTFHSGEEVTVFIANQLVRTLTLDRTRRYQPRS